MKRNFTNVFFLVAIAVAAMTSFVSCKDYEEDLRTEMDFKYQNLDKSLQDLKNSLTARIADLEAFKTKQEGINQDLQNQIDALKAQIEKIKSCECDLSKYAKQEDLDALETVVQNHYTELQTLSGQLADGLARITALEDAISKIKSCECNLDAITDRIAALEGRLDDFVTKEELAKTLEDYATRKALVDSIAAVRTTIAETVLTLRIEIESVRAIADAAYELAKNDSARIDYVIELAKNDSIEIVKIWEAIKGLNIPEKYDDTEIRNLISSNTSRIETLEKLVDPIAGQIQDLQKQIDNIKQCQCDLSGYAKLSDLEDLATKNELAAVRNTSNQALALAKQDSVRIDELKALYDALKLWADNLVIPQPGEIPDLTWIKQQFDKDKARMDILGDSIAKVLVDLELIKEQMECCCRTINERLDGIDSEIEKIWEKLNSIVIPDVPEYEKYDDKWIKDWKEAYDDWKTNTVDPAIQQIPSIVERLGKIEDEIKDLPEIREKITKLQEDLATQTERIDKLTEKVDDLTKLCNVLKEKLNKLITSIVVQAVASPLGMFNTPFDMNTNVLFAYYGESENPSFQFPTTIEDLYYKKDESIWVLKDVSVANEKVQINTGTLFEDSEGNAGHLYLTVNPTNVDFSGATFTLVDSRDKESPIKLGELKKSNEQLTFGYSSRAANNGFYSTKATITEDFAKALPHIGITEDNWKAIYEELKALKKDKLSFSDISTAVLNSASELVGGAKASAPAYGVKAAWTAGGEDYATYSKYEIAALSFSPLSYASANKLDDKNVVQKGIDVLEKAINKVAATIQKQVNNQLKGMIFDLDYITDVTETGFDIRITGDVSKLKDGQTVNVNIPEAEINQFYVVVNGKQMPIQTKDGKGISAVGTVTSISGSTAVIHFKYNHSLNEYLDEMDDLLEYLKGYLGDLNDLLEKMMGEGGEEGIA